MKLLGHDELKMGIAREVFDRMLQGDVFAWNTVIQECGSLGSFAPSTCLMKFVSESHPPIATHFLVLKAMAQ